jgi:hypothetical protein
MKAVYGLMVASLLVLNVTPAEARPFRGPRPGNFGNGYGPTCQILNQSGSLFDGCRESGEWRCYADVRFEDGTQRKIRGGCTTDLGACFSTGHHAVWPGCRE